MALTSPRASAFGYPTPPLDPYGGNVEDWVRQIAEAVRLISEGKINAVISVTLTANAATTTVSDKRIGRNTSLVLVPTTANAAAELATLYQTWPNASNEAVVLNHANNAQTDRTFRCALLG